MANPLSVIAFKASCRYVRNYFANWPLAVSFEVTHSCTANCRHCDKGGIIKDEALATPEQYKAIYEQIRPIVAQVSGGEPLLRDDLLDIIKALKNPGDLPYIVFITNASLLTLEKYKQLKQAGVDQFGISLDFPDERHDGNRRIPGLYQHLNELLPRISKIGYNDIALIVAITRENLPYLIDIVRKAQEWNIAVNFSMYTKLRTGDESFFISSEKDIALFRQTVDKLIKLRENGGILSSEYVLRRSIEFFEKGAIANCQAGKRSLVINPDGSLSPCAMKSEVRYWSQRELVENFSKNNNCGECYVSLRANTEKGIWHTLKDSFSYYASIKNQQR